MIYLRPTSQIVNRCSLFINQIEMNIEQGLTNYDFRISFDERPVETAKMNLCASK